MTKEYIERESAIVALQKCDEMADIYGVKPTLNDFKTALYSITPTDTEPIKHGKWLDTDTFDSHCIHIYQCSNCCKTVADDYISLHKYCLHCGSRMYQETEEND